jgi:rare lipoprotein A
MRSPVPSFVRALMHGISRHAARCAVWLLAPVALIACTSAPLQPAGGDRPASVRASSALSGNKAAPLLPPAGSGRGGYYQDDGPGDNIPADLSDIPDADPRVEPFAKGPSKPYTVLGKSYKPITDNTTPYKERGVGSWYGKKFHGQKTASGEIYDMYKMTAAHPTLPIPSYARVTNLKNGVQVIVRINDRGPFHSNRIIDLSYTAALKLGYLGSGSSQLEVERILPDEIERIAAAKKAGLPTSVASAVEAPVTTGSVAAAAMPEMAALSAPSMQPTASALDDNNPTIMPAPASAAQASPNPAATAAPPAGAYYLQFGAYAQEGNAQSARTTLTHSLAAVSDIAASLNAVPVNGMYRVYAGPYASRTAAQEAAQQVRAHSNAAPFVVESK